MTLGALFNPRLNGLNLLRLLLATGVIVHHSFRLNGAPVVGPLSPLLLDGMVDGFFAISGFLILASWTRTPRWWPFLKARALRILPAFWVCLVVTAFVLAPVGIALQGRGFPAGFWPDAALFVARNLALFGLDYGIGGTPAGLPDPNWNGSLWTLWWEFSCYLGILVLGVTGLLRRRASIVLVFLAAEAVVLLTSYGPVGNFLVYFVGRFGVMFAAGALVFHFRDRVPVRWWLMLLAAAITVGACIALPDYRVIAALPIAYLLITAGAVIRSERLRLKNDISYGVYIYAYPVQQLLVIVGAGALGVPVFAVLSLLATAPLAIASWFLVERPALRLKMRGRRAETVQEQAALASAAI